MSHTEEKLATSIKDEIAAIDETNPAVRLAELSTALRFAGGLHLISGKIAVEAEFDHKATATRMRNLVHSHFGFTSAAAISGPTSAKKFETYIVRVADNGETLARHTGLLDSRRRPVRGLPNKLTTAHPAELIGVLRGAFLARGTMTDPGRAQFIEFVAPTNEAAMALVGACGRVGISAKSRDVRGGFRVVIREADAVGQFLLVCGALNSLTTWQEVRNRREVRANANRLVNFDDANLRRSAQAAVAACTRVERAFEILGDTIPEHLAYAGRLRLEHREASLDELGHFADPVMTKDAVAGRIRRLLALADKHAKDNGLPTTDYGVDPEV